MNIHKLWQHKEYMTVNGAMLTSELVTRLHNSLTLLQSETKCNHMLYWGQIFAVDADYHIAMGITNDAVRDRKIFYTHDFQYWSLLPKAKRKYKILSLLITYPFRGDTSLKLKAMDEALEQENPDRCKELTEEKRLAATISTICDEAHVCARGEIIKRPDGTVVLNPNFYGLTGPESKHLKTYQHIRHPQQRWNTNLLTRQDYNYSTDFFDTIDKDIPHGCWNLSVEHTGSVVYLKNLYWPGMTYFHKINTPDAGFLYIGNGMKNLDVPFLLCN